MKICIVSDSYDRVEPLAATVKQAQVIGAQAATHCGDLIGANILRASLKFGIHHARGAWQQSRRSNGDAQNDGKV